jgi:hypothetical protein
MAHALLQIAHTRLLVLGPRHGEARGMSLSERAGFGAIRRAEVSKGVLRRGTQAASTASQSCGVHRSGEHQRPGGAADCSAIWHPFFCGFSSLGVFSSPDLLTLSKKRLCSIAATAQGILAFLSKKRGAALC